jgi:hypothetical protein
VRRSFARRKKESGNGSRNRKKSFARRKKESGNGNGNGKKSFARRKKESGNGSRNRRRSFARRKKESGNGSRNRGNGSDSSSGNTSIDATSVMAKAKSERRYREMIGVWYE